MLVRGSFQVPSNRGEPWRIAAVNRHHVWTSGADESGAARVLHFDGRFWREVGLPGGDLVVHTMMASPDHRPCFAADRRTAHRWAEVALPPVPFIPITMHLDLQGRLLVAGDTPTTDGPHRLFRHRNAAFRLVPTTDPSPAVRSRNVVSGPGGTRLGGLYGYDEGPSAIVHWNGKAWSEAGLGRSQDSAGILTDARGRPARAIGSRDPVDGTSVPGFLKHVATTGSECRTRRAAAPNTAHHESTP